MRVIRVNYDRANAVDLGDTVHDMQFQGHGVKVTVTDRPEGISIHVDPSNEPYMFRVKTSEVAVSSTQVRIADAKGYPDL